MCNTGGCWVKLPLRMLSLLVWKWEFTLLLAVPCGLIFVSVNFLVLYSAAHVPPFLSSPVFFYLGVTSFITRLIFLLFLSFSFPLLGDCLSPSMTKAILEQCLTLGLKKILRYVACLLWTGKLQGVWWKMGYLVELLGIIYRTGYLKGQAKNVSLPQRIFMLNFSSASISSQVGISETLSWHICM